MASWATTDMAWYSNFMVEREIVGYLLEAQEIAPEPMLKTNAKVNFLSSLSLS